MKKMLFFWNELTGTFWFLPVVIIGLAGILAAAFVSLDEAVSISKNGPFTFFLVNSADSARTILSTISGAMIGVAGTVFSVTLVALTLASSQFGPRLIKNFMYVRLNQVVLGSYIATYLYCLLVLNAVKDGNGQSFIPSISITAAILAAVLNIILLIVFIHQIASSIQADWIIADISKQINKHVETLYPGKLGVANSEMEEAEVSKIISGYSNKYSVKSPKSGYLQYIDSEKIMKPVSQRDSLLEIHHRPGSFLVKGAEIGALHSSSAWDQEALKGLLKRFVIGNTKTVQQDLEFSIHQMVEIAARALSPGINDPFTAAACIDNLTAAMCYLAEAELPSKYRCDEEGNLRVVADVLEFEGALDAAFNQIRQFSIDSPSVIIRLMEAQKTIMEFTHNESQRNAVLKHAAMVMNLGKENIKEQNDFDDLIDRAKRVFER